MPLADRTLVLIDFGSGVDHPFRGERNNHRAEDKARALIAALRAAYEIHRAAVSHLRGEFAQAVRTADPIAGCPGRGLSVDKQKVSRAHPTFPATLPDLLPALYLIG